MQEQGASVMTDRMVNVLVSSFAGLQLPPTVSIPLPSNTTVAQLWRHVSSRIPPTGHRVILTTLSNQQLPLHSQRSISELSPGTEDDFLSLRISIPVLGGKGGFGSQLRAAGGRMSSKRKKNQGENNGSSRNLDGRRIRTVAEAKSLAEYLAIKPKMERQEKEKRRKRWEEVVELAEKKEDEIRHGGKGKLDGKWVEDKEEAGERTRDAVLMAMRTGGYADRRLIAPNGSNPKERSSMIPSNGSMIPSNGTEEDGGSDSTPPAPDSEVEGSRQRVQARTFFGFDDEDDFMSTDEEIDAGGNG